MTTPNADANIRDNSASSDERLKQHFVEAETFQVTWWPKDAGHGDVQSQQTRDDHLLVTGLRPCTTYNVVVEARRLQSYADIQGACGGASRVVGGVEADANLCSPACRAAAGWGRKLGADW